MNKKLQLSDISARKCEVDELYPEVFLIHKFVTPAELEAIHQEISTFNEEEWSEMYLQSMKTSSMQRFGRDDLENLINEGYIQITTHWADKNINFKNPSLVESLYEDASKIFDNVGPLTITGFMTLQRMQEGVALKPHWDQYSDKLVDYAIVIYLNDDYKDGELFFPKFGLTIKPEAGDVVVFPGTEFYEHGVHPVGPGPIRYVIPGFVRRHSDGGPLAGWWDRKEQ